MSIAALRDENEQLKALLAQTQAALSEHQGAHGGVGGSAAPAGDQSRPIATREVRREVREAAARSVSLAAGRRGDRARHPGRGAGESRGSDQGRSRNVPDQSSHRNRGCLPAHLPQVERIIEPASTLCPCGCGAMTKIGEDVSKRLDVIPAQWRCWSRAARNTSVATARALSCRRTHRSTSCPAGCRPKRPLRT